MTWGWHLQLNLKMVTYPDYYMIDVAGWNGEIVLVCFVVHFVNSD